MPPVLPPNSRWLADELERTRKDLAALKAQQTQFVFDPAGVCQAIVGNVAFAPDGTATGLSGWGFASFKTGSWVKL